LTAQEASRRFDGRAAANGKVIVKGKVIVNKQLPGLKQGKQRQESRYLSASVRSPGT